MRARSTWRAAARLLVGLAVIGALSVAAASVATGAGGAKPTLTATDLSSAATETISVAKSDSGRLAQTDPALLGRTDSTPVNVMIKYDYDATASYTGGVAGLAPTSPRATGKKLKNNKGAVQAYESHTAELTREISSRVQQAVPAANVRRSFLTVYGGVEAQVPANSVSDLLKVDGVAAVQRDTLAQPLDDNTDFIGATTVWPSLGGSSKAGSNVIVGVIDTGVWPEHPMLSPTGISSPSGGPWGCAFGDGSDPAHLGPVFACNKKLIGAYAKTTTYMTLIGSDGQEFCNDSTGVCSARDPEGHGTHTLTTAAGGCVASAVLYGVERGPVCGIAPGAHVIMYRVCLSQGCFGSDSVSAVQQAIADGVDVINFSISGGGQPYADPVELAFLDAVNAGISVNASAGNSGPAAGTSDHGGPWTTTVGASTGPRFFTSTLHLTADGGATFDKEGVTLTDGISSPTPVVLGSSVGDELCLNPFAPGSVAGEIVACRRGTNARIDKGFNVLQGGAVGMILYNAVKQDVETDNHWVPAIHLDGPNTDLVNFISGNTNVMAEWAQGQPTATQPDVMAAFSSRGPTGDWIKPDVTAPGIQVLAGMTPQPDETTPTNGPPGNLYQAIAGTSMSSPHSAGVSALVKASHPDWTPEMIKSALMTSSVQSVVKEDGITPADPFDRGAGSIRADRAVNPTLVFDETYADFVAAGTDPLHRIDLNLASIDAPTMSGSITTKRTATNVTKAGQDLGVSTVAPPGASIIVSASPPDKKGKVKADSKIKLKKNKPTDIWITISAPELADGQYFGQITLDPRKNGLNDVVIPVAFKKQQGLVSLSHDCSPTTFPRESGHAHCAASVANFTSVDANVDLTVANLDQGHPLKYSNISAPATAIKNDQGVHWSGTLTPALPPTVDSITPTTGPAGGYLPLSALGVGPIAGVGDDTITNFNVPTFYYGGEPYSRIGVVSNGYVVIGGGTGSDVIFSPQTFPNLNRPNNVVAPLWTDLNPPAGGAIRIAVVNDGGGGHAWLVVDYDQVKNFSNSTNHSMELWFQVSGGAFGTGPGSEGTTISYGAANTGGPDTGSGGNSGAENRTGTSGKNLSTPADDTEWAVNTTPPTAGGIATVEYDASSKQVGTFRSIASMTSNVTPGTTQVVQTLTVTRP